MPIFSFDPPKNLNDSYYECLWGLLSVYTFAYIFSIIGIIFTIIWLPLIFIVRVNNQTMKDGLYNAIGCLLFLIGTIKLIWIFYIPTLFLQVCAFVYATYVLLDKCFQRIFSSCNLCTNPTINKYRDRIRRQIESEALGDGTKVVLENQEEDVALENNGNGQERITVVKRNGNKKSEFGLLFHTVVYLFSIALAYYLFGVFVRAMQYINLLAKQGGH